MCGKFQQKVAVQLLHWRCAERMRQTELNSRNVVRGMLIGLLGITGLTSLAVSGLSNPSENSNSPLELVRRAVANEVAAANSATVKHMFRSRKQTPQGSQTRLYVETREAMAGMTIAYNDKPLTPEQLQGEENHMSGLAANPEQLRHKHSQEQENADHTLRIVKALPDAFLYEFDGEEKSTAGIGNAGDRLIRLKFRPNPAYQPPSRVEQVLDGMQGVVVIDPVEHRIARIDGILFKEVSFGWGILGHLDKGGHFLVEQKDVGDRDWEISRMSLTFTGRILLVKGISIKSDEVFSDFKRVPSDTTFAQGVKMLEAQQAKLAQSEAASVKPESRSQ